MVAVAVPGFFGLLPDTVPPSQPASFAGHLARGALTLSWQGATDNSGVIASYQVLLDGTPVATLAGTKRRVIVRSFHAAAQTVYRVQAVDGSGIYGKPSQAVVVQPTKRPKDTPKVVPRWAWSLFTWQQSGGTRPKAAPKPPPAWYWHWAAWRLAPFHLRR